MNAPLRPAPTGETTAAYQPFIDGLRAISILAVVLYHSGVPGFPGGFVGVDVFFVISGYLIIGQIVAAREQGRFSFGDFWARRAWRILPPFMLVLVSCIAVAPIFLILPDELRDFGKQASNAAIMTINHLFLSRQGYFDTTSEATVLLHFWSLAVEEQFYLVAPLLIAGAWIAGSRFGAPRKALAIAAVALFALSLAGSLWLSANAGASNTAFYLAPLRAWEFIAGAAAGFLAGRAARFGPAAISLLAGAGLIAILVAATTFSSTDAYPGWRAILPVGGATAVIVAGMAGAGGPAIRLLGSRPAIALGLVSYSWYLWHWPLLALAEIRTFGERSIALGIGLSVTALLFAWATYVFLERPIRRVRQSGRIGLGWKPVVVSVVACIAVAVGARAWMDHLGRQGEAFLPPEYRPIASGAATVCDLRSVADGTGCATAAAGMPTVLVLGDSMVLVPRDALVAAAAARGAFVLSGASPACVPVIEADIFLYDLQMQRECAALHERLPGLIAEMGAASPRRAILYANWHTYTGDHENIALGAPGAGVPSPDQSGAFRDGLRATFARLRESGVDRILLIGPTPSFRRPAPNCLALADRVGADRTVVCGAPRKDIDEQVARVTGLMTEAVAGFDDVRLVPALDLFCDAEWCRPWSGDTIFYTDRTHLADAGIDRILGGRADDLDWLFHRR